VGYRHSWPGAWNAIADQIGITRGQRLHKQSVVDMPVRRSFRTGRDGLAPLAKRRLPTRHVSANNGRLSRAEASVSRRSFVNRPTPGTEKRFRARVEVLMRRPLI
jgi:hypothetical protein